ncbi:MAG: SdrD B-like domain-containing protein [Phycisphaerales bacterium]
MLSRNARNLHSVRTERLARMAGGRDNHRSLEALEPRQLMALLGVNFTQLPIEFFNSSGVLNFEASTGSFDMSATPTAILLPTGPRPIFGGHGDIQLHLRLGPTGNLLSGVNAGDSAVLGAVNSNGDDFVLQGAVDLDGDGSIGPGESGVLLRGEAYAFGFQDSGGATDDYDVKLRITGGLLAHLYGSNDMGITVISEASNFTGDFGTNFGGQAKGNVGPVLAQPRSSISGFVYYDANNDGTFQNTESPIPGTTVTLTGTDELGNAVSLMTTTDSTGYYFFGDLRAGNYTLTETQPAGFLDGIDTIGTPGGTTNNDQFTNIMLPNGFDGVQNNFGEILASSISGYVYYDANNDCAIHNSESTVPGTTVTLTGVNALGQAISLNTTTDGTGYYFFGDLRPGNYTLTETQPAGFLDGIDTIGTPGGSTANDQFSNIVLPAGFDGVLNNFGEILASSISGFVYYDANNDGTFQNTESPIPGTTVALTGVNDLGQTISLMTTTNAAGFYIFANLRPGNYTLTETQPAGFLDGIDTIGTPGGSTANDQFSNIVLPAGFNGVQNNFGEILASSVNGYVYCDANQNCVRDNSEVGISGVTITLTGTNDLGQSVTLMTQTNGAGFYAFAGLRPGTYRLAETQPAGTADGAESVGSLGGNASVNDVISGIVVAAGVVGNNYNFGEICLGSISGTKFLDVTGNGLTGDDTGMGGVTIFIDANNNGTKDSGERSTVTAADGTYYFTGLMPGNYIIREVVPANFVRTAPVMTDKYTVNLVAGQTVNDRDFANAQSCLCYQSGISNIFYTIYGADGSIRVVTDLRGNTNQGDQVQVTFTTNFAVPQQFTLVSYTAPSNTFIREEAYLQEIFDLDTGFFGVGTFTLTVTNPDCNYQVDFVCGAAIDTFGPSGSNIFYGTQNRLLSADNDGCNACVDNAASVSGNVYKDQNNNGIREATEDGIQGVRVTLTGTNNLGQSVNIVKFTDSDGIYSFGNLRPGTYRVTETQPGAYIDGIDTIGTLGGNGSTNDQLSNIVLVGGSRAENYNFGERLASGCNVNSGMTATIGFWQNRNGQNLIKSMNGGPSRTNLGNWLASNFPNLYGSAAGSANNLTGKTNSQVAEYYKTQFNESGMKIDAQFMALAFAVYVTDTDLAGGNFAAAYGFIVNSTGTGGRSFNVGSAGTALGVSNNANRTIMQILQSTNSRSSNGNLFNGNSSSRTAANALFDAINQAGDIL